MVTVHYVEYDMPGSFFPESRVERVETRDPEQAAANAPKHCFAFQFFSRSEVEEKGEVLRGPIRDKSKRYFIGGKLYNVQELEAAFPGPDHRILVSNMRCNRWPHVIQCRTGNWQPFEDNCELLKDPTP